MIPTSGTQTSSVVSLNCILTAMEDIQNHCTKQGVDGYYDGEEEIKNNELFKKRFKQNFMKIEDYSEMELWNPNIGRRYIFDEDDFYGNYYDKIWNTDKGFELYYQRYM